LNLNPKMTSAAARTFVPGMKVALVENCEFCKGEGGCEARLNVRNTGFHVQ
jgi:predicted nucleic acid binding AN1-type Zn finger protein